MAEFGDQPCRKTAIITNTTAAEKTTNPVLGSAATVSGARGTIASATAARPISRAGAIAQPAASGRSVVRRV